LFWIYHVIQPLIKYGFKEGWKKVDNYHLHMAYAEDQAGSVTLGKIFNKFFTKGNRKVYYNDEDNSISYTTAMNFYKGASPKNKGGLFKMLEFFDKGHGIKSITGKIDRDIEAYERLKVSGILKTKEKAKLDKDSWKKYVANVETHEERVFKPSRIIE